MKYFLVAAVLSLLSLALAKAEEVEDGPETRRFACSQVSKLETQEGEYTNTFDRNEDSRPTVINIPSSGADNDIFSEDGRYYSYSRMTRDGDMVVSSLFGVFDFRRLTLSTSTASFGVGQDGVSRSYAGSYKWTCTDMEFMD